MQGLEFNLQNELQTSLYQHWKKTLFRLQSRSKMRSRLKNTAWVKFKSSWIFYCKPIRWSSRQKILVRGAEHCRSIWWSCCSYKYCVKDRLCIGWIHVLCTPEHMLYIIYSWCFWAAQHIGVLIATAEQWKMIALQSLLCVGALQKKSPSYQVI